MLLFILFLYIYIHDNTDGEKKGREGGGGGIGGIPPTRTDYRVRISNLSDRTDWRQVKDFLRDICDPCFVDGIRDGETIAEFRSFDDANRIVRKLDDERFQGRRIHIKIVNGESSARGGSERGRDRRRSRSRER